jgi:hypothetical protein
MQPNPDDEPIIKVLWLSGVQSSALSDGKYQFIAIATGKDIRRFIEWLDNQANSNEHWIVHNPSKGASADLNCFWICFIAHSDPVELKKATALGTLFKSTWQDKYWNNGLKPLL